MEKALSPMDSSVLLEELRYDYYSYVEPPEKPELSDTRFSDIVPELSNSSDPELRSLAGKKLYKHQEKAYASLLEGKNVILRSGTGSGKTEAWLLYAIRQKARAMAVYPTLALANDQIRRIHAFARTVGFKTEAIDALRRDDLVRVYGRSRLRSMLGELDVLVTNPAFLMNEIKNNVSASKSRLLDKFLSGLDLVVLDELDFYGPREIALLLSMLKLLRELLAKPFKVAVLTATLGNPEELASYLSRLTGYGTAVIYGKPFRVENRVYVVLGKNLKAIWSDVKKHRRVLEESGRVGEDLLRALDDYSEFRKNYYKVVEAARALGIRLPSTDPDPIELLLKYLEDDGVTLVFTRSIAKAEELARRLRAALPPELASKIAAHHHLASKTARAEAEELARRGELKLLISPRTLAQGIDIGLIARIVHVGLPESVREYHQREGRKGRREELEFSETIVLPVSRWDRELLSRGLGAIKKWLELPLEKVIVNPDNKYMLLFEALAKLVSPVLRRKLSREEYEFLKSLGLVEKSSLTSRGKRTWRYMNFYEFAPPYGIKRIIEMDSGGVKYLEDISHCDLVERFQPGSIDYTSDGVVVNLRRSEKGGVVTAVVEEKLSERALWRNESLAQAYEEYEKAKYRWGERPNIVSDYANGRLHSEVLCVVYPPRDGFGRYVKIPNRVVWRLYSSVPRVWRTGDKTIVRRDLKLIDVPTSTAGRYSDYTYGFFVELNPEENVDLLRIGLAFLMIVLRRTLGVAFETIMYETAKIGEKKFMGLHEPESAGLLEKLDWLEVKKLVEEYQPDELDDVLMEAIDEYAYSDFLSYGLKWELAKTYALKALDYLLLRERITLLVKGRRVTIKKPSRALKLLSFDAMSLPMDDSGNVNLVALAVYDGENVRSSVLASSYGYVEGSPDRIRQELMSAVDSGFGVLVYGLAETTKTLEKAGLGSLSLFLKALKEEGRVVDVGKEVEDVVGVKAPLSEIEASLLGARTRYDLAELRLEYEETRSRSRDKGPGGWERYSRFLKEKLERFVAENARSVFLLHLALNALKESRS